MKSIREYAHRTKRSPQNKLLPVFALWQSRLLHLQMMQKVEGNAGCRRQIVTSAFALLLLLSAQTQDGNLQLPEQAQHPFGIDTISGSTGIVNPSQSSPDLEFQFGPGFARLRSNLGGK